MASGWCGVRVVEVVVVVRVIVVVWVTVSVCSCCGDRSHDATQGHNTPTYLSAIRVCV